MIDPNARPWAIASSLWNGFGNLFPTWKAKMAVWGLVGLGVITTFMELLAAQLFSTMITGIDDGPTSDSLVLLIGFVVAFSGVKVVQYFQSVYRLTVFEKSFRRVPLPAGGSDAWRWPMAIALVGVLGLLARLLVVIVTVAWTQLIFGIVLVACSAVALAIVSRTGRRQYVIHHEFADAKLEGRPATAGDRIRSRVRAGERAGLAASVPILLFVAALGFGAVEGRIAPESALLLFIAGRMAANTYGGLATSMMRYIRSEVNVEVFSDRRRNKGKSSLPMVPPRSHADLSAMLLEAGVLGETPGQAVARLIDQGVYLGDAETIGRIAREQGFGPLAATGGNDTPTHSTRLLASGPNKVWCLYSGRTTVSGAPSPLYVHVVVDVFSRAMLDATVDPASACDIAEELLVHSCRLQGVSPEDLTMVSSRWHGDAGPTLHDLLKALGVSRALRWSADGDSEQGSPDSRPSFPTRFESREMCEAWIGQFVTWYNSEFFHPDVGYLHPVDVHGGLADTIAAKRLASLKMSFSDRAEDDIRLPASWWPPQEAFIEMGRITTRPRPNVDSDTMAFDDDLEEA